MEYWTTNCEQKMVGIHCPESLPIDEGLPYAASRREGEGPESALGSIRLHRGVVLGCFIAALIGLCLSFHSLLPVSSGPSLSSTEPVVAQQHWKISSVSIPILGAPITSIAVDTPTALIMQLKELGLWELEGEGSSEIPPVVFTNFPNHLSELSVGAKKRIFLHSLLPVALVAMIWYFTRKIYQSIAV